MGLFDTFTGAAGKKQALGTKTANDATANQGYEANQNFLSRGYDSATGRLGGYAQQGQQANTAYGNLLGLGGSAAQGQARQGYEGWNPYLQGDMNAATGAVARRMNAGGNYNSGMNLLAQQRATQELGSRDFYNYNDRLSGQGQMGYGAAGQLAGLDTGYGQSQVANRNMLSGQLMGNQNAYNQQYAQADGALWNNMMGIAGLGISGLNAWNSSGRPRAPVGNNYSGDGRDIP